MRSTIECRKNDWAKAIRKQKLYRYFMSYYKDEDLYDNLHQYSKNKIHVSDAHGGNKTNNRGRKKYYGQACKLWKPHDLRQVVGLEEQL